MFDSIRAESRALTQDLERNIKSAVRPSMDLYFAGQQRMPLRYNQCYMDSLYVQHSGSSTFTIIPRPSQKAVCLLVWKRVFAGHFITIMSSGRGETEPGEFDKLRATEEKLTDDQRHALGHVLINGSNVSVTNTELVAANIEFEQFELNVGEGVALSSTSMFQSISSSASRSATIRSSTCSADWTLEGAPQMIIQHSQLIDIVRRIPKNIMTQFSIDEPLRPSHHALMHVIKRSFDPLTMRRLLRAADMRDVASLGLFARVLDSTMVKLAIEYTSLAECKDNRALIEEMGSYYKVRL